MSIAEEDGEAFCLPVVDFDGGGLKNDAIFDWSLALGFTVEGFDFALEVDDDEACELEGTGLLDWG